MTNAFFGFPRYTADYTLSSGNWLATYPVTNLQELPLSYVARSVDDSTGSTTIQALASAAKTVGVVALVGHNMSQAAQIRLRTWSDNFSTLNFDSTTENVWAASYTAAELSGANWLWYRRTTAAGSAGLSVRAIQIDITDTSNVDGYVEAGYLEIASAFDVTWNFVFGAQYGFEWRSVVAQAIGGAEYVDARDHPRLFKGLFEFSPRSESLGKFFEMQRQLRMDEPILFVPHPDETSHLLRTALFARQTDPGLITMRTMSGSGLLDSVPVALKEIIG